MSKNKTIQTEFICLDCGETSTQRRTGYYQKEHGYVRKQYCFNCRQETKQYELKDKSTFLWKYNNINLDNINNIDLDINTKRAILLLKKREDNSGRKRYPVLKKVPTKR